MRLLFIIIMSLVILTYSCKSKKTEKQETLLPMGVSKIIVKETFNAGGYTYINAENGIWLAVGQRTIETGKSYYYKGALEMRNFHSKELNRDFPLIYFVTSISNTPVIEKKSIQATQMKLKKEEKIKGLVEQEAGTISIAELYAQKEDYSGKLITVKGKVTKLNKNIMGRNWIHLQDGSEFEGNYDLTITSPEMTMVGEIVKISGTVILNKDFGAGYSYPVLLENGEIVK